MSCSHGITDAVYGRTSRLVNWKRVPVVREKIVAPPPRTSLTGSQVFPPSLERRIWLKASWPIGLRSAWAQVIVVLVFGLKMIMGLQ